MIVIGKRRRNCVIVRERPLLADSVEKRLEDGVLAPMLG
jgi:hypothetical protein